MRCYLFRIFGPYVDDGATIRIHLTSLPGPSESAEKFHFSADLAVTETALGVSGLSSLDPLPRAKETVAFGPATIGSGSQIDRKLGLSRWRPRRTTSANLPEAEVRGVDATSVRLPACRTVRAGYPLRYAWQI